MGDVKCTNRDKYYVGQACGKVATGICEYKLPSRKHGPLFPISVCTDDDGHPFSLDEVDIFQQLTTRLAK